MNDKPPGKPPSADQTLADQVGSKARRKLRAQRRGGAGVWFGLGMMGLVGWSVAVPTLAGAAIGMWLDKHYPGKHAWTLALLIAGLALGCFNAWRWIVKEDRAMHDDEENDDDDA